jgi:hypothetical protein
MVDCGTCQLIHSVVVATFPSHPVSVAIITITDLLPPIPAKSNTYALTKEVMPIVDYYSR